MKAPPAASLPTPILLQSQVQAGTSQLHLPTHTCSFPAHNLSAHTSSAHNLPAHSSSVHNSTEPTGSSSISQSHLPTFDLSHTDHSTSLSFGCFNSRGLISSLHYIQHILNHHSLDFLAISEHWLHEYNLNVM